MSTETTTTAARAANKAGQKIIDTVSEASDHVLPSVVETAEVAMAFDVPTKVVLNQKLIVTAAFVGGGLATAGVLFGVKKFQAIKAKKRADKIVEAIDSELVPDAAK